MRNLLGILKDKLSLIKATLLLSKPTTTFHVAVLRATTHYPIEPPPDYTVDDVLALGHHHRPTAATLIAALLRRLRHTQSAYVALKCLLTLHHILLRGSFVLKDQILSSGPHLNLSNFRDGSDADTLEISGWVRWYAAVIEQNLAVIGRNRREELNSLVVMVEQICRAPDSLNYQKFSLIYEAMKLVGEDYRMILREISTRINEIEKGIEDISDNWLEKLLIDLKRLEDCKEKALLMFLNKKRNDGVWDLIGEVRKKVEEMKERRESMRLVVVTFEETESTRVVGESNSVALVPAASGKRWLDVDWNPFLVPLAC